MLKVLNVSRTTAQAAPNLLKALAILLASECLHLYTIFFYYMYHIYVYIFKYMYYIVYISYECIFICIFVHTYLLMDNDLLLESSM